MFVYNSTEICLLAILNVSEAALSKLPVVSHCGKTVSPSGAAGSLKERTILSGGKRGIYRFRTDLVRLCGVPYYGKQYRYYIYSILS